MALPLFSAAICVGLLPDYRQVGVGQHGQGDVPVPALPFCALHTGPAQPAPWPPQNTLQWSNEYLLPPPVPPGLSPLGRSRRTKPTLQVAQCLREKNSYLAILNPPRLPTVLPLHSHRLATLLQKPRLVHHQHPVSSRQMFHYVVPEVIPDLVRVPDVVVQQALHPVGRSIPRLLRQLRVDSGRGQDRTLRGKAAVESAIDGWS